MNLVSSRLATTRRCQKLPFLLVLKPPRYVITTIITPGYPVNPVIDFLYGRICPRKLVQVRNEKYGWIKDYLWKLRSDFSIGCLTFCPNQKFVCHNNISPPVIWGIIVLLPIAVWFARHWKWKWISQYILDKSLYSIPITDDRVGRKMDAIQCSKLKFQILSDIKSET